MKSNKKKYLIVLLAMVFLLTGCTKSLTNDKKEAVKNPETGQTLTENILCQPENEKTIEEYNKYKDKVDVSKLPKCDNFKINSGKDEGIWTNIFVKPLAWFILKLGKVVKNYGLGLIIASLIIRLIAVPVTRKTAMQSELLAKAKPDLDKIEKKYAGKEDQESLMKKTQEIGNVYRKYNISPASGCIYAFLQLPLFIAFLEAINRVPAIFEDSVLKFGKFDLFELQLGTTPFTAIKDFQFQYLVIVVILGVITYFSFKMNVSSVQNEQSKMMSKSMVIMIIVMSFFMTTALDLYWLTSNIFTVIQNVLVKRSKKVNE